MPLVTATLADLYLRQGHFAQAISVLEALLDKSPGREDLARKLAHARSLEAQADRGGPAAAPEQRSSSDPRQGSAADGRLTRLRALLARVQSRRRDRGAPCAEA